MLNQLLFTGAMAVIVSAAYTTNTNFTITTKHYLENQHTRLSTALELVAEKGALTKEGLEKSLKLARAFRMIAGNFESLLIPTQNGYNFNGAAVQNLSAWVVDFKRLNEGSDLCAKGSEINWSSRKSAIRNKIMRVAANLSQKYTKELVVKFEGCLSAKKYCKLPTLTNTQRELFQSAPSEVHSLFVMFRELTSGYIDQVNKN